jgi:hypothetical protein
MDRAQVRAGDGSRANLRPRLTSSKATIVLSVQRFPQVARSSGVRFNGTMRGRAILILLGLTAFGAYSGGRQGVPISNAPVAAATSPSVSVKPVAFIASAAQVPAPVASSGPASAPKADSPERAAAPDTKVEAGLTTAAMAAVIVQASRDQYPVRVTTCGMAEHAADGAPIPDRAVLRRVAIQAT